MRRRGRVLAGMLIAAGTAAIAGVLTSSRTQPTPSAESVPEDSPPASAEEQTAAAAPTTPASFPAAGRRGRRRARVRPPTQDELDALPVKDRQDLYDAHRQRPWQVLTSLGVLFSVLFTAGGLLYTARTWQTSQETQIADRYTKAVEQLGSSKIDVRLGGIYALERLAKDSLRDHQTIYDVLAAFVRQHDPQPKVKLPKEPATDIQAALTVISRRDPTRDTNTLNLREARIGFADLAEANLTNVKLTSADLTSAKLIDANLIGAKLTSADLTDANLRGAYLISVYLTSADLIDADLRGADLQGVIGQSEAFIRSRSRTDGKTRFGPLPSSHPSRTPTP